MTDLAYVTSKDWFQLASKDYTYPTGYQSRR